jgi:hypothetical protein
LVHARLAYNELLPPEHLLNAGYTSAELLLTAPAFRGITIAGLGLSKWVPPEPRTSLMPKL